MNELVNLAYNEACLSSLTQWKNKDIFKIRILRCKNNEYNQLCLPKEIGISYYFNPNLGEVTSHQILIF
jgi:hypothetical protein